MAIAIREQGERSKVATVIATLTETGIDGKPVADQSQMNTAKSVVASEIAALPTEFNGVLVIVGGLANENIRQLTVQIIGQKGHF